MRDLEKLLKKKGYILLQVPILEEKYVKVDWDEFHGDNTKVYHRFAFDLSNELKYLFPKIEIFVGMLNFEITSNEIKKLNINSLKENFLGGDHALKLVKIF